MMILMTTGAMVLGAVPLALASGGVSKLADLIALHELVEIGIEGAIVGKAIYSGNLDLVTALKEVSR